MDFCSGLPLGSEISAGPHSSKEQTHRCEGFIPKSTAIVLRILLHPVFPAFFFLRPLTMFLPKKIGIYFVFEGQGGDTKCVCVCVCGFSGLFSVFL